MSRVLGKENYSGGHFGENTWNARLSEALKSRGFNTADFELIFPTLRGIRKPDVPFQCERGLCFVSAKLGSNKETDAVASAYEYLQSIGEVNEVAEAFSLTYPSKKEKEFHLRVLANKEHQTLSWILCSLEETAEKIYSIVKKDWESAQLGKESTVTSAIRVLRSGVVNFSSALTKTPPEEFENIFGGKYFFESVLGYEKIEENQSNDLKSAAAYLFVNQILFYEILARETKDFPTIEKEDLSKPEFLKPKYFDLVLKIDYRPIFNFDIASKLQGKDAGDSCKKIILAIRTLFPEDIDHDVIGKVFHNVIPLEIRKVVAAYFTNNAAGDLLARLSIFNQNDKIMDPACGSGTLLVSSYKRKLQLSGHDLNETTHQKFIQKELTGIDIMPFSAHLAAVNLALLGLPYKSDILRIAIGDSTKRKPGDKIEPAREVLKEAFKSRTLTDYLANAVEPKKSKVQAGAVALDDKGAKPILLEKADVVIMNPPFTSCDNLPEEYKTELKKRFTNPVAYSNCLTGKLSFQAYFLLLADRFLDKNGKIACVLPFSTFVGKAFKKIDEFLVKRYSIKCIICGMGRSAYSDNTSLTEILFVAEKTNPLKDHRFALVATKNPPTEWSDDDVVSIQEQIDKTEETGLRIETRLAISESFLQTDLIKENSGGLNQLVLSFDSGFTQALNNLHKYYKESSKVKPFVDIAQSNGYDLFAYELRIKGGAHYGSSALSISASEKRMKKKVDVLVYLDSDERELKVMNRFTKEVINVPRSHVTGQVRRFSDIDHMNITKDNEFIICSHYNRLLNLLESIYPEIEAKEFEKRIKREWTKKVKHGISNFTFVRRINLAAPGTRLLALFSDSPRFLSANSWGIRNLQGDDGKIMCLWFNSTLFLMEILSKHSPTEGSWGQLDERYIFMMNCIDPSKINSEERKTLLNLFDEVQIKSFPSLLHQLSTPFELRKKIDTAFLNIIRIKETDQATLLEKMRIVTLGRITSMKETMGKN